MRRASGKLLLYVLSLAVSIAVFLLIGSFGNSLAGPGATVPSKAAAFSEASGILMHVLLALVLSAAPARAECTFASRRCSRTPEGRSWWAGSPLGSWHQVQRFEACVTSLRHDDVIVYGNAEHLSGLADGVRHSSLLERGLAVRAEAGRDQRALQTAQ